MKINQSLYAWGASLVIGLSALIGCRPAGPDKQDKDHKIALDTVFKGYKPVSKKYYNTQRILSRDSATQQIINAIQFLSSTSCAGNFCQKENIWQYLFRLDGVVINSEDTWLLHKGSGPNGECIFLLTTIDPTGRARNYRGGVNCPRMCGYTDGSLSPEVLRYVTTLTPITPSEAVSAIGNQVAGLTYTIRILPPTVERIRSLSAKICGVYFGNVRPDTTPDRAFVYCNDDAGAVVADPAEISNNDFCVSGREGNLCNLEGF